MRQAHRAGEKGFVDYAGKTPWLTDPATGERLPVELFVAGFQVSIEASERLERPPLRPAESFEYADWLKAGVNVDYHIAVEQHFYSVPHTLVPLHERLDARLTATAVEVFHRGQRVAAHRRSFERGHHTTLADHMPKAH